MDKVLEIIKWAVSVGPEIISSLVLVLTSLVAFFLLIPGDQPEKAIQGIVDFLKKFSKK